MLNLIQSLLYSLTLIMAVGMSYLIYMTRAASNDLQKLVVYIFSSMMNGMLLGPFFYLLHPGSITITQTIELSSVLMMVEVLPFLAYFFRGIIRNESRSGKAFLRGFLIAFVILDELLMSIDFNIVSDPLFRDQLILMPLSGVLRSISSSWFILPMSAEMVLSSLFSFRGLSRFMLVTFLAQAVTMPLIPTAFNNDLWVPISIYLSGSIMTGYFVFLFEYLYRNRSLPKAFGNYAIAVMISFGLMMAGVGLWQLSSGYWLLSAAIILQMVIFGYALTDSGFGKKGRKLIWIANRNWSFGFLLFTFIAEFFMGMVFDFQYFGAANFVSSMQLATIGGSAMEILGKSVYNFFMFFAGVSLSVWFLVMMGIEMGSLVVFKIRITRDSETKIRLSLMLLAYAVYSIYLPSFFLSDPAKVPFVGWSMGLGTAGGVTPLYLLPIILTYVISGALSFLFGSRQLCSTFCTAPVMYQGTFYDAMKGFNRSNPVSRSLTLANRYGRAIYRSISLLVYFSIGIAAVLSYLDSLKILNLTVYGTDPEYMVYLIIFGFVWYAVFILMPFVGSYGCINTGYCSWGNFNRFISRFGFFRLKVRDSNVCVSCETKACATACPIGNYGQPSQFISKGEYKDSRCVGIGDCVNACPYDNIFYFDVRHWIRNRLGKASERGPAGR
ncbi:MAG: hypothetical protein QW812_02175 [Thermoplasmataceae archaeon]